MELCHTAGTIQCTRDPDGTLTLEGGQRGHPGGTFRSWVAPSRLWWETRDVS